ncbi:MAG: YcxB family protein [Saprospiraceae bacterium]
MTITYSLSENDFLTHQLYAASTAERIIKKRQRARLIGPLIYLLLGLYYWFVSSRTAAGFLVILAILWYFIYPIWERNYYVRHYQAYIRENFRDRIGKLLTLTFEDDHLFAKESGMESKIPYSELSSVIEIPATIFLKLKTGEAIVLPKSSIQNLEPLKEKLKALTSALDVPYVLNEQWRWK